MSASSVNSSHQCMLLNVCWFVVRRINSLHQCTLTNSHCKIFQQTKGAPNRCFSTCFSSFKSCSKEVDTWVLEIVQLGNFHNKPKFGEFKILITRPSEFYFYFKLFKYHYRDCYSITCVAVANGSLMLDCSMIKRDRTILSVCISKRMQIQPESWDTLDIVESCLVQHFDCWKIIFRVGLNITLTNVGATCDRILPSNIYLALNRTSLYGICQYTWGFMMGTYLEH